MMSPMEHDLTLTSSPVNADTVQIVWLFAPNLRLKSHVNKLNTVKQTVLCLIGCACGNFVHVLASLKHRSVMHYGYRFDYAANAVDRTPLPRDIPVACQNLMERLLQQNLISQLPDQMTVNQYQPGQGKNRTFMSNHTRFIFICCSLSWTSRDTFKLSQHSVNLF